MTVFSRTPEKDPHPHGGPFKLETQFLEEIVQFLLKDASKLANTDDFTKSWEYKGHSLQH